MATTATTNPAASVSRRAPTTTRTSARATLAHWTAVATSAETPAWYRTAPTVKLCGVATGSLTDRSSVT